MSVSTLSRRLWPDQPRSNSRPRRLQCSDLASLEVSCPGGKAAHVNADLGNDRSCCQRLDAGGGHYLFDGGAKGRNGGLHLPVDPGNCRIEGVDLIEMKPQQEAMLRCHAAAQSLA